MFNPDGVPDFFPGTTPDVLAFTGGELQRIGRSLRSTGYEVNSAYEGLASCYHAPEASTLITSLRPAYSLAYDFGSDLENLGSALAEFAGEMKPPYDELQRMLDKARAFVERCHQADRRGEDWRSYEEWVAEENSYHESTGRLLQQMMDTQVLYANRIEALIDGAGWDQDSYERRPPPGTLGRGGSKMGLDENPPPPPWGAPEQWDKPWILDLGDAALGMVDGLTTLTGIQWAIKSTGWTWDDEMIEYLFGHPPADLYQTLDMYGELANDVLMLANKVPGIDTLLDEAAPGMSAYLDDRWDDTVEQIGDDWGKGNEVAAILGAVGLVPVGVTGLAGGLSKLGKLGRLADKVPPVRVAAVAADKFLDFQYTIRTSASKLPLVGAVVKGNARIPVTGNPVRLERHTPIAHRPTPGAPELDARPPRPRTDPHQPRDLPGPGTPHIPNAPGSPTRPSAPNHPHREGVVPSPTDLERRLAPERRPAADRSSRVSDRLDPRGSQHDGVVPERAEFERRMHPDGREQARRESAAEEKSAEIRDRLSGDHARTKDRWATPEIHTRRDHPAPDQRHTPQHAGPMVQERTGWDGRYVRDNDWRGRHPDVRRDPVQVELGPDSPYRFGPIGPHPEAQPPREPQVLSPEEESARLRTTYQPPGLPGQHRSEVETQRYRTLDPDGRTVREVIELTGSDPLGTMNDWVHLLNRHYWTGIEFQWNCSAVVRAFADTVQGLPPRLAEGDFNRGMVWDPTHRTWVPGATPGDYDHTFEWMGVSGPYRMHTWTHPQHHRPGKIDQSLRQFTRDAYDSVAQDLLGRPPGTVTLVCVRWRNGQGHWFAGIVGKDGQIIHVDVQPQPPTVHAWPPPYPNEITRLEHIIREPRGVWEGAPPWEPTSAWDSHAPVGEPTKEGR